MSASKSLHIAAAGTTTPAPFIMRMGCTNALITYRAAGNEAVCLQRAENGMQRLANFDPSKGDILGLNDILERTQAHANLSDVANYITSQTGTLGTTLYIDPTGTGKTGTAFAFLQNVSTNVAALVANGGMKYVPDQVVMAPQFNTPFTVRPDGLETILLRPIGAAMAPQEIKNFDPTKGDVLELKSALNKTAARPDLTNLASYVTATYTGGNTVLSVDSTGHGLTGTAFAVLDGVHVSVADLVADHAVVFDPTQTSVLAKAGMTFICRPEGAENIVLADVHGSMAASQIQGFSLGLGDGVDVMSQLTHAGISTDLANIENYVTVTHAGGNTSLWFDATGAGHNGTAGGTLEAVFQNSTFAVSDLLAHSALQLV